MGNVVWREKQEDLDVRELTHSRADTGHTEGPRPSPWHNATSYVQSPEPLIRSHVSWTKLNPVSYRHAQHLVFFMFLSFLQGNSNILISPHSRISRASEQSRDSNLGFLHPHPTPLIKWSCLIWSRSIDPSSAALSILCQWLSRVSGLGSFPAIP